MGLEDVVGHHYDRSMNQLPYGGAIDTNGKIAWVVTREEYEATMDWIQRAFAEDK